jgi:hypothetical protein
VKRRPREMEEEEEEDVFSRLSIRSSICLIIFNFMIVLQKFVRR